MSLAYVQPRQQRGKSEVNQAAIQKMLDENNHLIQCILDHQSKGKTMECSQYQQMLHRNLVYLATLADSSQNTQSLLPTLPNQNITMAQGGLGHQVSGSMNLPANNHGYSHSVPSSQGLPAQAAPMGSYGGRPTGSDRQVGRMIAQQGGASQYSIPQSVGQHYQGMMGQNNASGQMMAQRQMPGYSRAVLSAPAQQYASPDDYFGEQYAHGQSSEGMGHQYYSDGRNDFSYQQPSYPEQGFDRTFEDPSQHYYDGGSGQYTQQQSSYQAAPQQGYPQQFTGQQGYSSQQQGYGAAAGTAQYTAYPQAPGQQYGAYRPPQSAAPNAQQQRSYTYEQIKQWMAQ
uniref:protein SSXT isoform X3 n=1 Tax=Myxine glutinosa TaxID=7769 RepID=UPI00358F566F